MRINTGSVKLQVENYENRGEPIIFLHFGGGNMVMWREVVPFFKDDYHVILIDLRGHGKSEKPKEGYHIDDLAEDVVAVMKWLEIDNVYVVGSSLGAEVGLSLAANFPKKVRALVCEGALFNEGGPYGLWDGTDEAFALYAQEKIDLLKNKQENIFNSVNALVNAKKQLFEQHGWWNDTFEAMIRYDAVEKSDGKYVESWERIALPYTTHNLFYNFGDYYERVECPVLMMPDEFPGQDERELAVMGDLFKLVKHGKITRVPGWVHPFGWMITPEAGSEAVRAFIKDIEESSIPCK